MGWLTARSLVSSCLLVTACRGPVVPAPDPAASQAPGGPALSALVPPGEAPAPSAQAPVSLPTLVEEELAPEGVRPSAVFAVEGAVMAVAGFRVGRITGDRIDWLKGTIPTPEKDGLGPLYVNGVYGRWPDSIGATFERINGRISAPQYFPLLGVARSLAGFTGWVVGAAQVGASTIVVGSFAGSGVEFETVRGTAKRKPMTREAAACKERGDRPALDPRAVAATRGGTMVTVGQLCEERAGAEIWDTQGKSRIVDLRRFWKEVEWRPLLLGGDGEDLWAMSNPWSTVLRFREGAFEAVPDLGRPIRNLFVSPRGVLHASDGRILHRLDPTGWTPVALLPPGRSYAQMVMDEQDRIWVSFGAIRLGDDGLQAGVTEDGIRRLRPGPSAPLPSGCATPFVYLYVASYANGKTYTYPKTRKALSTFPEAATLGLVEFDDGRRRLGVTVTSMAQGAALIDHLHQTMKEDDPRLFCFDVSTGKEIRKLPVP
jgi:hypothetical protein